MSGAEASINPQDASQVVDLLDRATELQLQCPLRRGSAVDLPARGRAVLSGDLHDQRRIFQNIINLARLDESSDHHVVLQEVIHSDRLVNNMDLSYRALVSVAELQVRYPGQVHQLLSNHELAQIRGEGISKDGVNQITAFNDGLQYVFGDHAQAVTLAIERYIRSMPLAVRTATSVMCSHSLPSPRRLEAFDPAVLDRSLTEEDLKRPLGSAYLMVWGRRLNQDVADALAATWGVDIFVLGHQAVDMGYEPLDRNMLVINSDHNHAVALPIDLTGTCTRDSLIDQLVPVASIS